jgi:flagellar protein FlaG
MIEENPSKGVAMVELQATIQTATPIPHATMLGSDAAETNIKPKQQDVVKVDSSIESKSKSYNIEDLTNKLNERAKSENLSISFTYNEKLNRSIINVIDKKSGEVIRKLPSDEAIKFAESIKEAVGKLLDKKG